MALQTNRPSLTQAQLAFSAAADLQAGLFSGLKRQFNDHTALFPLSGTNSYGFTRSQMLSGLGTDSTEFNQAQKRLLVLISDIMPSFPEDTWAARPDIRPWYTTFSVDIPSGF